MEAWVIVALVLGTSIACVLLTFFIMKRRVSHSVRRLEKKLERARETKETKPKEAGVPKLDDTERAKLELEYRECCQDWRWRDKYVLDKLGAAGILFMLLGVALGLIEEAWVVKLGLLLIGAFFSFILSISVAKDTYYRDGTEKLLRRLSARLGISGSLKTLESLEEFEDLQFTRKIKIQRDKYSLRLPSWLKWLQNPLLNQKTFQWILIFYLVSLFIFVILFVLILVSLIWRLNPPI